jgi:hypothetical protein
VLKLDPGPSPDAEEVASSTGRKRDACDGPSARGGLLTRFSARTLYRPHLEKEPELLLLPTGTAPLMR